MKFGLGESVIVKKGVKEPDLEEFEISGWQGRVLEIDVKSDKKNILIVIEWDSKTLEQIPSDYIEQSERDGLDWKTMTLYEAELEKTKPRDKLLKVKQTQDKLSDKHKWDWLGDAGARISKVLGNLNPNDEMNCLQKWVDYLDEGLSFPVPAIIFDSQENWLIKSGDKVVIKSLPHFADMYGIIATIKLNGEQYQFPLCDLEVIDKKNANYKMINDYQMWFANK